MTEVKTFKPWYKKWWGILLTVVFFPVVVPYLVWAKTNWNKWVKIAIIAFCVVIVISIVSGTGQNDNLQTPQGQKQVTENFDQNTTANSDDSSKYIAGLAPVDVYQNLEKQGFNTEKNLGGEVGNTWTSTKNYSGIDYRVVTFSSSTSKVESVRGSVIIDLNQKEIIAAQPFLIYLSSLPYDNADQQKAEQWIKDNYNNDKATITIGDAKFTIYAPSIAVRMLDIENAD